jgi:TonB family protein
MLIRFAKQCLLAALFAILALAAIPAARAQEPQSVQGASLDALAAKMADAISVSKQKNVIVPDFVGPANRLTALGRSLAEEFSAAIVKDNSKIKVLDRSGISRMVEKNNLAPLYMVFDPCNSVMAEGVKAKSCVSGKISTKDDAQILEVTLLQISDFKKLAEFSSPISLTPEMQEAGGKTILDDPILVYRRGGEKGYTMPVCLVCHFAYFTDEAVQNKTQGTVTLAVVVGENGSAEIISVLRRLPDGLTESAVKTVKNWKFKPGTGPDGNPAAMMVPIEVRFNLKQH